jgi:hypothetical protein
MSITIAEAIARIPVRPGQPFRTQANGQEIEVRVIDPDAAPAEVPEAELWLDVPASSIARSLTVTRGPAQLPAPIHVADTDLTPG